MFHLCAFSGSIGATANTDTPAVADQILTIQNTHLVPPQDMRLIAAMAIGALLNRARINTPKLRQYFPLFVRPIIVGATPGSNPNMMLMADNPPTLRGLEEIAFEVSNSGAGPTQTSLLLMLQDRYEPWPAGDVYVIRGTSTTAAVANVWTDVTYTLDQNLPAGRYAMGLSEVQSTTGIAHRWIFDNQFFRPGNFSHTGLGNRSLMDIYRGALGKFGEFKSTTLPRLQVFAGAADASHEIYMWCVPIPGGVGL